MYIRCITEGMCAIALFWGGGDEALKALRAVSICMGLPLTFVSDLHTCEYVCLSVYNVGMRTCAITMRKKRGGTEGVGVHTLCQ